VAGFHNTHTARALREDRLISDNKPKADAQQSFIDQGSYLFVLAATAISLSGCAFGLQNNSVQRAPDGQVDYCSYPNIASALKEGLRKTQGGEGASLRDIVTVPINGFDKPANPHAQTSFVCHATLVQADGKSTTGRIVVSLTLEGVAPFSKINIEDITWMSDADFENKRTESAAQSERNRRALIERQKTEQAQLERCDPAIKAHYDAAIHELSTKTADYFQHLHENETTQEFTAYVDTQRAIMQLHVEELQACSR
jgi:hypothetical protein